MADDEVELDNAAFLERVEQVTAALSAAGVGRGDVVALALRNCAEFVCVLFAVWRLGASLTPINPALTATEIDYQLADSGADVMVGIRADHPQVTIDLAELDGGRAPEPVDPLGDDVALIIYTSGTTGRPKGVLLSHANVRAMAEQMAGFLELGPADRSLLILPLFHANGIMVSTLAPLLAGGSMATTARFSPSTFFPLLEKVRPTYFSAVPAIYALLVSLPADVQPDLSSLRVVACGAAPMPAELISAFEQRFGVPLVEGYGLSEATCASTVNPLRGPRKPGTVGLPLPGQQVSLRQDDGSISRAGVGEVVISGPVVMLGYLGRPEETAATIVGGWLRTGDVGRFDDDGYLLLVDRIKDMIIRGGENLYPKEIETALHEHPAVLEAAVAGAPDPVLGEIPVAQVVLRTGASAGEDELRAHCATRLARVKVPVRIDIVSGLPRNAIGKVDKSALREMFAVALPLN